MSYKTFVKRWEGHDFKANSWEIFAICYSLGVKSKANTKSHTQSHTNTHTHTHIHTHTYIHSHTHTTT